MEIHNKIDNVAGYTNYLCNPICIRQGRMEGGDRVPVHNLSAQFSNSTLIQRLSKRQRPYAPRPSRRAHRAGLDAPEIAARALEEFFLELLGLVRIFTSLRGKADYARILHAWSQVHESPQLFARLFVVPGAMHTSAMGLSRPNPHNDSRVDLTAQGPFRLGHRVPQEP